jgi:predicted small metal-binding protein
MKTMTCKELGGGCDKEFTASTFEEIAEMSKQHGKEMFQSGDGAHLKAMQAMQELMKDPQAMQKWFEAKRAQFNAL